MSMTEDMRDTSGGGLALPPVDIRDLVRREHEDFLAELDQLGRRGDVPERLAQLRRVQRLWVVHAIVEETVVYKAIETGESSAAPGSADERFSEHEQVKAHFAKLLRIKPGTVRWHARLAMVRTLISHHVRSEQRDVFARLEAKCDAKRLGELGEQFERARAKLTVLEEAKAARRLDRRHLTLGRDPIEPRLTPA